MKTKFKNSVLHCGTHDSFKMQKVVPYKSTLERDFYLRNEFDLDIIVYTRFDELLDSSDQSHPLKTFPCFFVFKKDSQREVILLEAAEVNNSLKAQIVKNRIEVFCQNKGLQFTVLTESDIRKANLIPNLKTIYKNANSPFSIWDVLSIKSSLKDGCSISIGELKQTLFNKSVINTFLFLGVLQADLSSELISDQTLISRGKLFEPYVRTIEQELTVGAAGSN
jgi:hypothetical protein